MDQLQMHMLKKVADLHSVPEGAYNIRDNGTLAGRNTTANIDIISKEDKPGIDIVIKPGTKNESVHIPVIVSQSGLSLSDCMMILLALELKGYAERMGGNYYGRKLS